MKRHRTYPPFVCSICKQEIARERSHKPIPYLGERCCANCFDEKAGPALLEGIEAMPDLPEDLQIRLIDLIFAHHEDEDWIDRFVQRRRAHMEAFAAELFADQQLKDSEPVVTPAEESK